MPNRSAKSATYLSMTSANVAPSAGRRARIACRASASADSMAVATSVASSRASPSTCGNASRRPCLSFAYQSSCDMPSWISRARWARSSAVARITSASRSCVEPWLADAQCPNVAAHLDGQRRQERGVEGDPQEVAGAHQGAEGGRMNGEQDLAEGRQHQSRPPGRHPSRVRWADTPGTRGRPRPGRQVPPGSPSGSAARRPPAAAAGSGPR